MMSKPEYDALRLLFVHSPREVRKVNGAGSVAATESLLERGLIARDPEWTGCFVLTDEGDKLARRVFYYDEG
jgi:hypothetical protein